MINLGWLILGLGLLALAGLLSARQLGRFALRSAGRLLMRRHAL